jgi:dynein light intermediate chain
LQEQLDQKLQQRQARETGICPIREELYAQCFDELIRQITINCGERGLLLLRVRDDIRMTIAAYQTLYESSIAFGMRQALMAEQRKRNMEARIRELEQQCDECEKQVHSLQDKIKSTEKYEETKRAEEQDKHREQMELYKKTNEELKRNLESLLSVPTKK